MSNDGRWCILRTAGPRTLPLTRSLCAAGLEAWTPIAVRRLPPRRDGKVREREMAIMPTFVFARARFVMALAHEAAAPASAHPYFSLFRKGNRVPLIGEREMEGLRAAEADAQAAIDRIREGEAREQMRRERAERMRTDRAKRKALRTVRLDMHPGTTVAVSGMPALAGMVGEVVEMKGKGAAAVVAFGGSLVMEIEAWQLLPNDVANAPLVSPDRHSAAC